MVIPMDSTTSPQVPQGPMTRARARAIENEVTSLLSQLPFDARENWMLPQTETLCVIRYLEEGRQAATTNGQDGEDAKREEQEGELPGILQPPDDRSLSDVRRLEAQPTRTTSRGTLQRPDDRRNGRPTITGNPTLPLQKQNVRKPKSSGRPAHRTSRRCPEIRQRPTKRKCQKYEPYWTSGPSRATGRPVSVGRRTNVSAQWFGPRPMYPFAH